MKKKILFISFILLLPFMINAQEDNRDPQYKVEGEDVIFTKTIEDINCSKDEIYQRALVFFANAYNSANDVIQMKDKEAGTVIGKGIFTIYKTGGLAPETIKCDHTLRIDAKDGRSRIILSVNTYDITIGALTGSTPPSHYTYKLTEVYPFTEKKKKQYQKIFKGLCDAVDSTFSNIEKTIKAEGSIANDNDW